MTDATERKRARDAEDSSDASEDSPEVRDKRRRVDDHHMAFVLNEEVAQEEAQWGVPRMKERWGSRTQEQRRGRRYLSSGCGTKHGVGSRMVGRK